MDAGGAFKSQLHVEFYPSPDRVQGGCGSHVRQEADLQHVEQEVLVVDTVNSVQEQNHGGLVVRDETGRHLGLNDLTICSLTEENGRMRKCEGRWQNMYVHDHMLHQGPTFAICGELHREADDSHQVFNGDQRTQDGPDPQSLTLAGLDQLYRGTNKQ